MQDWIAPVVAGVAALVALALAVALLRARSRTDRAIARLQVESQAETAALRDQVAALERRVGRPKSTAEASFVITDLGHEQAPAPEQVEPAPTIGTALFADLVLRETVVKAASFAHGVRRAFDAETRNRIRFEMRREVKRARKQRKADTREAVREWQQRQRADLPEEGSAA